MGYLLLVVGLAVGVVAIVALLRRVSAKGGESSDDAAWTAGQVLAELDAWRGIRSEDAAQWEGERRLARPEDGEQGLIGLNI